jgi:hypothetical protein
MIGYIRKYGFYVLLITVVAIELVFLTGCSNNKTAYIAANVLSGQPVSDPCQSYNIEYCGVNLWNCPGKEEFHCLTNVVVLTVGTP